MARPTQEAEGIVRNVTWTVPLGMAAVPGMSQPQPRNSFL